MPCDVCGNSTRVVFKSKIITNMTVGSVRKMNISSKYATSSLQGNSFPLSFIERNSRKRFLDFSKSKDKLTQTKDLL